MYSNLLKNRNNLYKIIFTLCSIPILTILIKNYFVPFKSYFLLKKETNKAFSQTNFIKNYQIISILNSLSNLPPIKKKETILYIPQSNHQYWNMLSKCEVEGLIAPAMTGMALLDGISSTKYCSYSPGSLPFWNPKNVLQLPSDKIPKNLCKKIKHLGFKNVIVIDSSYNQDISIVNYDCSQQ